MTDKLIFGVTENSGKPAGLLVACLAWLYQTQKINRAVDKIGFVEVYKAVNFDSRRLHSIPFAPFRLLFDPSVHKTLRGSRNVCVDTRLRLSLHLH